MNTPPPARLPQFKEWIVRTDGKAAGTASIYARFLTRCAEHYGTVIDEQTIRSEGDVQRVIGEVNPVVTKRGRWAKGTFNHYDVTRNLIFALQAYARFARANYPAVSSKKRSKAKSISKRSPTTTSHSSDEVDSQVAMDVPTELPARLKTEISRVVRDSRVVREVKAAHDNTCQICGLKLELAPGRFYSEAHHLQPLGRPHNGPDVNGNVICVCPNCHVKLDFAAIPIERANLRDAKGHKVGKEYIEYHNSQHQAE